MSILTDSAAATWGIAALATIGVIARPWRLPEAIWAVAGAAALVGFGLLSGSDALMAIGKGADVYLFLIGMMLLAELARIEGLFDWAAAIAARQARGSASRLFGLTYVVGIVVTVFLSNDATAVVLTPAVYAVARAAGAPPLPYLFICAFIANAASFVLPISNPANLVVFGSQMPPLLTWLSWFTLPSVLAIGATFVALRLTQAKALRAPIATDIVVPALPPGGHIAAWGLGATAVVLLLASGFGLDLGLPTALAGLATTAIVLLHRRAAPWRLMRSISWEVLPLVAGLFVLVEGLDRTGVVHLLAGTLQEAASRSIDGTSWGVGVIVAVATNLMNNLPAGLIVQSTLAQAPVPPQLAGAALIGVDLGPNLSVTGSLATILWLVALRREGIEVGALQFLRLGCIVMPPALLLALAGFLLPW
ncbi:arsenical pump membrane protein [Inquilinus ginsengisoli]|uniref:Arsenical pump membrane protein n=1 Tax=Inquilinus ginsengisoli TaxID=363840 RepID=A0ABU1JW58_9PROT|nr:arsenic transporter [Inquilinus ginsengisoli]MDR6292841.1 arsenical pump membrane protein [Inquilinus ginsengisoli]